MQKGQEHSRIRVALAALIIASQIALLSPLLFVPSAHAVCLNPLGCKAAETQGECLKEARNASTEAVAKAMVSQCSSLPTVTLAQCKKAETEWATYLRQTGGVEWTWPAKGIKRDCLGYFPGGFTPALWVTPKYCADVSAKLARTWEDFDKNSRESLKVTRAKREFYTSVFDPVQAVEMVHQIHYPGVPIQELAAAMNVDAPPDQIAVAAYCEQVARGKKQ